MDILRTLDATPQLLNQLMSAQADKNSRLAMVTTDRVIKSSFNIPYHVLSYSFEPSLRRTPFCVPGSQSPSYIDFSQGWTAEIRKAVSWTTSLVCFSESVRRKKLSLTRGAPTSSVFTSHFLSSNRSDPPETWCLIGRVVTSWARCESDPILAFLLLRPHKWLYASLLKKRDYVCFSPSMHERAVLVL